MVQIRGAFGLVLSLCLLSAGTAAACTLDGDPKTVAAAERHVIRDTPFDASELGAELFVVFDFATGPSLVPAQADGADGFTFLVPIDAEKPFGRGETGEIWLTDGDVGCTLPSRAWSGVDRSNDYMTRLFDSAEASYTALGAAMGISEGDMQRVLDGRSYPDGDGVLDMLAIITEARTAIGNFAQEEGIEGAEALIIAGAYLSTDFPIDPTGMTADHEMTAFMMALPFQTSPDVADAALMQRPPPQLPNDPVFQTPSEISTARKGMFRTIYDDVLRLPETDWTSPKSAAHLSLQMRKAFSASSSNKPHVGGFRDTGGTLLGIGSAVGQNAGGLGKGIAIAYEGAAQALFAQSLSDKVMEGLYPSEFVSIGVEGGPFVLWTDKAPKSGAISSMNVVTRAKGLDGNKIVADIINQFFPYKSVSKPIAALAKRGGAALSRQARPLTSRLKSKFAEVFPKMKTFSNTTSSKPTKNQKAIRDAMTSSVENFIRQALAAVNDQRANRESGMMMPPFDLPAVNILDNGWHQTSLVKPGVVSLDFSDDRIDYSALADGTAQLLYGPMPGKWGNASIWETQGISVDAPMLRLHPERRAILPGETATFMIEEKYQTGGEPYIDYIVSLPDGFDATVYEKKLTFGPDAEAPYARALTPMTITTPPEAAHLPMTFQLRIKEAPRYAAAGSIESGKITPESSCVDAGQSIPFSFVDRDNIPIDGVSWKLEGAGRLDGSGLYTAPEDGKSGTSDVIATSRRTGEEIARQSVRLGCRCEWSLDVDGRTSAGSALALQQIDAGVIEQFVLLPLEGISPKPTLTGMGSIIRPGALSVTVEDRGRVLQSGLGALVNIREIEGDSCRRATTVSSNWFLDGAGWLSASVGGSLAEEADLTDGCVRTLVPFTFNFRLRVTDAKNSRMLRDQLAQSGDISPEARQLLRASQSVDQGVSACLSP